MYVQRNVYNYSSSPWPRRVVYWDGLLWPSLTRAYFQQVLALDADDVPGAPALGDRRGVTSGSASFLDFLALLFGFGGFMYCSDTSMSLLPCNTTGKPIFVQLGDDLGVSVTGGH
ncbi:unnamed protein product [Durusdinium trenchii]|uniref:Uncharacterized protein n=1 Tax=Durusdinium trenchii TaxID=1381693 RepID=A0ABP0QGQ3_9DINO